MLKNNNYWLIGAKEIADYLQAHENTVYAKCKSGELGAVKRCGKWRIRKNSLDAWLMK